MSPRRAARAGAAPAASRRLMLRLGRRCNSRCAHCTILDLPPGPDRTTADALAELERGRRAGCDEVVLMRGEPTIRKDIVDLVRAARAQGYRLIQLQTNGRMLCYAKAAAALVEAGATHFEVSLYGDEAPLHDAVAGEPGAFEQTAAGLRNLIDLNAEVLVTIPVVAANFERLPFVVARASILGARRVQLNFTRPVRVNGTWNVGTTTRLAMASPAIRQALATARALDMAASTEGVPLCHLDPGTTGGDADADLAHHMVSDLHLRHDSLGAARQAARPEVPECCGCRLAAGCAQTWPDYLRLFGGGELVPVR